MKNFKFNSVVCYKLLLIIIGCAIIIKSLTTQSVVKLETDKYLSFSNSNVPCYVANNISQVESFSSFLHHKQLFINEKQAKVFNFFIFESEENEENDELTTAKKYLGKVHYPCFIFIAKSFTGFITCSSNNTFYNTLFSYTHICRNVIFRVFRI